jgi:hypothetical protein
VGAFELSAGADADIEGGGRMLGASAGGKSRAERETLARDGDDPSCDAARDSDKTPPNGCGALIRIEVVPVAPAAAAAPAEAGGGAACPPGTSWDGLSCAPAVVGGLAAPAEAPFVPVAKPKPPSGKLRAAHYVVGGLALASLGVGVVTGVIALSDKSKESGVCNAARDFCTNPSAVDAASAAKTSAIVSTVTLGVGVAALFVLPFIPLDRSKPAAALTLSPAPGGGMGALQGAF